MVKDTADEVEELKDEVAVILLDVAPAVVDELGVVLEIEDDVVTEETVTPALLVMELVLLDTTVLETTTVEVVVVEAVFGTSVMDG